MFSALYLKLLVVNGNMTLKDVLLLVFPLVAQLEAEFFYGYAFWESLVQTSCKVPPRLHMDTSDRYNVLPGFVLY